jgi:uncharacterized LabA/DUF88 family protein
MNRVAVFIDAGYLYASAIKLLTGIKQSRSAITLSYEDFLEYIIKQSEALTRRELLRVYWYDGTSSGPTGAHRKLAYQANVKLRLGMVSLAGEQKGVDSLLIMDMANLAQNRAMSDAVVLTGDEDIRVGVVLAQQYGVRVHLVGIADPDGERNQSSMLQQEADTTGLIGLEEGDLGCGRVGVNRGLVRGSRAGWGGSRVGSGPYALDDIHRASALWTHAPQHPY